MPEPIDSLTCAECGKGLPPDEYVELAAMVVRDGSSTHLGSQMFHYECWLEMQGEDDGE